MSNFSFVICYPIWIATLGTFALAGFNIAAARFEWFGSRVSKFVDSQKWIVTAFFLCAGGWSIYNGIAAW